MSRAKIVDHYIARSRVKGFDISVIRKEMEALNFNDAEIRIVVHLVDADMIRRARDGVQDSALSNQVAGGLIITAIGVIIAGLFHDYVYSIKTFFAVYGVLGFGLSVLMTGMARRKS